MKIGILTFSAAVNYGAILQTYALMKVLNGLGHDTSVIDYNPEYFRFYHNYFCSRPGLRSLFKPYEWKYWIDYLNSIFRRFRRNTNFEKFKVKYLNIDDCGLQYLPSRYDILVCGSDQIWNPELTGGYLDDVFFGLLPTDNRIKTISYAASVGSLECLENYKEEFIDKVRNLSFVSVREQNLANYIHSMSTDLSVECVLDPTLLVDVDVFNEIASHRLVHKPYLLYFDIFNDEAFRKQAKKIAKIYNLKFIEFTTYHEFVEGQKLFRPGGPEDFCSLVKFADIVVTTSFHATVFSLLFHKKFIVLEYSEEKSERMVNILNEVGLADRFFRRGNEIDVNKLYEIDWERIDAKLDEMRVSSIKYLYTALTDKN